MADSRQNIEYFLYIIPSTISILVSLLYQKVSFFSIAFCGVTSLLLLGGINLKIDSGSLLGVLIIPNICALLHYEKDLYSIRNFALVTTTILTSSNLNTSKIFHMNTMMIALIQFSFLYFCGHSAELAVYTNCLLFGIQYSQRFLNLSNFELTALMSSSIIFFYSIEKVKTIFLKLFYLIQKLISSITDQCPTKL